MPRSIVRFALVACFAVCATPTVFGQVSSTNCAETEISLDAQHSVARLDRCLRPVREANPGLPIERHVVDDTALRALLEQAAQARVVVVGHRRGSDGRHLGSTSRGLVAFAPCPVVVIDLGRD